jgi:hypothetical protein
MVVAAKTPVGDGKPESFGLLGEEIAVATRHITTVV